VPVPCRSLIIGHVGGLLPLGADTGVDTAGHLPLTLQVRVLIDQRGPLGGLPGADHRVLERGTRLRRERVTGVTRS
jgi:hypothetical protein